jgi:phosphoadenosine phosphosulfate reductase
VLIASPRHTKADLALWRDLEEADIAHATRTELVLRVREAANDIRDFARTPCYAGVSWGKDSTVLLDLICQSGVTIPIIWLRYGLATNPECYMVRDSMLRRWPDIDYREIDVGDSETMRDDFRPACESAGTDRYLSGIRGDESGTRKMSIRHLGIDTGRTCRPLGWWKAADVFAYLAYNELPVNAVYGMLGGGRWPRQHIRTSSIGGERGSNFGRAEWEREYYGDELRKIGG